MNTYEKCVRLRKIIVNRAAEIMVYQSWENDFSSENIRKLPEKLAASEKGKDLLNIDPCDMSADQMRELGFERWEDDNPMMLIPLWLFPFLKDEFETDSIDGETGLMRKDDMDVDSRFGCLAYGVIPRHIG